MDFRLGRDTFRGGKAGDSGYDGSNACWCEEQETLVSKRKERAADGKQKGKRKAMEGHRQRERKLAFWR